MTSIKDEAGSQSLGLGLYVAKELPKMSVEQHRGQLGVQSSFARVAATYWFSQGLHTAQLADPERNLREINHSIAKK